MWGSHTAAALTATQSQLAHDVVRTTTQRREARIRRAPQASNCSPAADLGVLSAAGAAQQQQHAASCMSLEERCALPLLVTANLKVLAALDRVHVRVLAGGAL